MSRHEDTVRIRHMLDYARETVALVQARSRRDLDSDRVFSLALVRLLEIVGEAASRVSQEARLQYPHIPWWQVVNLRNRLIHGYYEVDFDILWQIVVQDLPPLIAELEKIVPPEER